MNARLLFLAAVVATVSPVLSNATVYAISDQIAVGHTASGPVWTGVSGTLATDGKTGLLSQSDITGFDLSLSDQSVTDSLASASGAGYSLVAVYPWLTDGLSVSGNALTFDFGMGSAGLLKFFSPDFQETWILAGGLANCPCNPSVPTYGTDYVQLSDGNRQFAVRTDVMTIGTAEAVAAPEIDPIMAAGGLTLLFGVLAVLRGRRRKPQSALA